MIIGKRSSLAVIFPIVLCQTIFAVGSAGDGVEELRLNQIQIIGTHNSYHVAQPAERRAELAKRNPSYASLGYSHPSLDTQLNSGVRGFESDVYYQPEGFFKVLHVHDFDDSTTCDTLVECLQVIREWSLAHPTHVPIMTHIEVKDRQYEAVPTKILPVNAPEIAILERGIRSVFGDDHLFEPDDLRGDYESVNAAVLDQQWPKLEEVRGKCLFILHNRGRHRQEYLRGNPGARGRALFNFAVPGDPDAAFLIRDNPSDGEIPELVHKGYVIRTRDGGPRNPTRVEAALASGAHLISTDYPMGEKDSESGYVVEFEDGTKYRRNAVSGR